MNYEEALNKAMGCLRLSKSSNPAEAAAAAAKAQGIIQRYKVHYCIGVVALMAGEMEVRCVIQKLRRASDSSSAK